MIEQIHSFFSINMIYLWINFGVLPFWLVLLFFPQSRICKIFVASVFPLIVLAIIDFYLFFEILNDDFNILYSFNLYLGIDDLLAVLSEQNYILIFWIHFLAINLFCGSWIVRDYQKINMSKYLAFLPLIVTYFVGPFGLLIYWILKIFYIKNIDLYG